MKKKSTITNKTDEEIVEHLEKLSSEVEASEQLYEAALKGLSEGINANIKQLDAYDLGGKMAAAEDDIAMMAAEVVKQDVAEMGEFEESITKDDAEEDWLLADDELSPEEKAAELATAGEVSDEKR